MEAVEDASYEVYLYRGSKNVYKSGEIHTSSCDLFPYMSSKGTYTFKVRALPSNDEVSKYASKSDWTISDEVYIDENDAARAAKKSRQAATTAAQIIPEIPSRPVKWKCGRLDPRRKPLVLSLPGRNLFKERLGIYWKYLVFI